MSRKILHSRLMRTVSTILTYFLCYQSIAVPICAQQQTPQKLNIVILGGEGAINNIRQRVAREPIVQVEDENHKPVAGAVVIFLLPDSGPGGSFPGGAQSLTVKTDAQGRAAARGLRPNNIEGEFQIQVTAAYQGVTVSTTITQSNALGAAAAAGGGISGKLLAILAVAGGAVAAGVVAATRGGNGGGGPATPSPTVISAGPPNVGAPR
jgi:hypothetical protein